MNVADYLADHANRYPSVLALVMTRYRGRPAAPESAALNFSELDRKTNRIANGLRRAGLHRGSRTIVLIPPGFEFVAVMFALFRLGAVPVLIDPGMGLTGLLNCVRDVDPTALIAVPKAQALRVFRKSAFQNTRIRVTVGKRWFWGGPALSDLEQESSDSFTAENMNPDDPAAIFFTSGSTGPAKGVVYTHAMFDAQIRAIQCHYAIETAKDVDMPGFAPFAFFNVAMGVTTVFPDMDFSHPGRVDPRKIVQTIQNYKITNTFGSPAMWKRVAAHCLDLDIQLPSLRRVMIAGAPVPAWLIEQVMRILPNGADVHTPYGATEALPVASIRGSELIAADPTSQSPISQSRTGRGTCVGVPVHDTTVRLIRISDDPIETWTNDLEVDTNEPGEIVVTGPVVTTDYFTRPAAVRLSKIRDGDRIWHRMGDLGLKDAQGRLWFLGRKAHRVVTNHGTLFTEPCEAVFNEHPAVARCALVGVGSRSRQTPVIIIEPKSARLPRKESATQFRRDLLQLAQSHPHTRTIQSFLFHRSLPVDVRHNAKIRREDLAQWAASKLKQTPPTHGASCA